MHVLSRQRYCNAFLESPLRHHCFVLFFRQIHKEFKRLTGIAGMEAISQNIKPFIERILGFVSSNQDVKTFMDTVRAKVAASITIEAAEGNCASV